MSTMSDIDIERQEDLRDTYGAYLEAYNAMMDYMDKHPPAWRKLSEVEELARLDSICMVARMHYERAQSQRYKV